MDGIIEERKKRRDFLGGWIGLDWIGLD